MIGVIGIVAILLVSAVAVFIVAGSDDGPGSPSDLDEAELKVFGNINGDRFIDSDDVTLIEQLIDDGASASDYPMADANRDGEIDSEDVDVVRKIINGEKTTVWHVNQHDKDGNGTVDSVIVDTKFPITSAITHGNGNTLTLLYSLGIHDEIKGCSRSSSVDYAMYGDIYMSDDDANLGTSSSAITFEDGKVGSSNVIAEKGVTAVITQGHRSYLTNEADFEGSNIDVVRVSPASSDPEFMTHTILLLGLLFQKVDRADAYLDYNLEVLDYVDKQVDPVRGTVSAVASSMTGYISVGESDYRDYIVQAGGAYGLDHKNYGSTTSLKIVDYKEVYLEDFQRIIHFRTGLNYDQTPESNEKNWNTFSKAFSGWRYAENGQAATGGSLAPSLRVAYAAVAMYPDQVTLDWANEKHQEYLDEFCSGNGFDVDDMKFLLTSETMS